MPDKKKLQRKKNLKLLTYLMYIYYFQEFSYVVEEIPIPSDTQWLKQHIGVIREISRSTKQNITTKGVLEKGVKLEFSTKEQIQREGAVLTSPELNEKEVSNGSSPEVTKKDEETNTKKNSPSDEGILSILSIVIKVLYNLIKI